MRFHTVLEPYVDIRLSFIIAVSYVLSGLAGRRFMEGRKGFELTNVKVFYNLVQVVVCSVVFAKLLPFFTSSEHGYGFGIKSQPAIEFWVFVYYCCKVLDFGDTFFMVIGNKTRQFTLLHVWHHASIVPLFAYYLSEGIGGGFIAALPFCNSLVHVIMYSHYLATAAIKFKKIWWKPLITGTQMGHHVLCMVYMVGNYYVGNPECNFSVCACAMAWGASILGLFAHFFWRSYAAKTRKSS